MNFMKFLCCLLTNKVTFFLFESDGLNYAQLKEIYRQSNSAHLSKSYRINSFMMENPVI